MAIEDTLAHFVFSSNFNSLYDFLNSNEREKTKKETKLHTEYLFVLT